MIFDGTVQRKGVSVILQTENIGIQDNIRIDMDVLIHRNRSACEVILERAVSGYHATGFNPMLVLVDSERADKTELVNFSDLHVGLRIKRDEQVGVGDDVQLDKVDIADDLVDQRLDVGVPDADGVIIGCSEEKD